MPGIRQETSDHTGFSCTVFLEFLPDRADYPTVCRKVKLQECKTNTLCLLITSVTISYMFSLLIGGFQSQLLLSDF